MAGWVHSQAKALEDEIILAVRKTGAFALDDNLLRGQPADDVVDAALQAHPVLAFVALIQLDFAGSLSRKRVNAGYEIGILGQKRERVYELAADVAEFANLIERAVVQVGSEELDDSGVYVPVLVQARIV